jgi:uncharacterized protein (TIGR03118 family)
MKPIHLNLILKSAVYLSVALAASAQNSYRVANLVSNVAGGAPVTDPNLVDPWGISASATSPFWVSNHVAGNSTLYNGAGAITAVVVKIPGAAGAATGKPTGQVQNSAGSAFTLANGNNASFIFATEDGLIAAWNTGTVAEVKVDNSSKTAVYKGLALGTSAAGATLYAANFHSGKIDTWGPGFTPVTLAGSFIDGVVPAGYAPFNVANLGGNLYVTYAKQDATLTYDVAGPGNGYLAVFDLNGNLIRHLAPSGALNSPWGLAIAPATWPSFAGALLVGNFGDGTINAYSPTTGLYSGTLLDATTGQPIVITGLWGLIFGGNGSRSDSNTLYFTAGMPTGSTTPRGLFGSISAPTLVMAIANAASWQQGSIAPGEIVVMGGVGVGTVPLTSTPVPPASGTLPTTLGGVTVTVNGIAAPLFYTSGVETSFQVPNELTLPGVSTAFIVVKTPTQTSQTYSVPLVTSAPGIFTNNTAGTGQIVTMNQDGTLNSTTNPAARGSTITFYATGEGTTVPAGQNGVVQTVQGRVPVLTVAASIGGQSTSVVSAGTPLGLISGEMQVQLVVPTNINTGPQPVVLTVGTASTTQNATIVVK